MKLLKYLVIAALLLGGTYLFVESANASSYPVDGQTYYLSGAGITSTQNTIQLTSLTSADGTKITMTNFGTVGYGTLEPQSVAKVEFISFTGITQNSNGTATLTGVTRGQAFVYPYASTVSLEKAHAGGAQFIVSNSAPFYYNEFAMPALANVNVWPFASTSVATKGYVDFVAFNGAGVINADTSNKGVVQIATGAQAAASTQPGTSGAYLALTAAIATSTYNTQTAANDVLVSSSTGHLDANFLSTTTASSTVLATNGAGKSYWVYPSNRILYNNPYVNVSASVINSTTTVLTIPIPANTLNAASTSLRVTATASVPSGQAPDCWFTVDYGNGTASTTQVGYEISNQGSSGPSLMQLNLDAFATSTTGIGWLSNGYGITMSNGLGANPATSTTNAQTYWKASVSTSTSVTAQSYLAFNLTTFNAALCTLNQATVEVLSQT